MNKQKVPRRCGTFACFGLIVFSSLRHFLQRPIFGTPYFLI